MCQNLPFLIFILLFPRRLSFNNHYYSVILSVEITQISHFRFCLSKGLLETTINFNALETGFQWEAVVLQ